MVEKLPPVPARFDEPGADQEMVTGACPPVVLAVQDTGSLAVPDSSQLAVRTRARELIITVKS